MLKNLVLTNTISLLGQVVQVGILPVALPLLAANQGYSTITIGIIASALWIPVLFLSHWLGKATNEKSAPLICATGMGFTLCSCIIIVFYSISAGSMLIAAFLCGIGLSFRWIAADSLIISYSKNGKIGRIVGIHETLMGAGIALGPLIVSVLGTNDSLFIAAAVISATAITLSMLLGIGEGNNDDGNEHNPLPFFKINKISALSGVMEVFFITYLVLFLTNRDWAESDALLVLSAFGLGGAVLQPLVGYISDRKSISASVATCLVSAVITCLLFSMVRTDINSLVVAITAFICGGAAGGLNTLGVVIAGSHASDKARAEGVALVARSYTVGSVFTPLVAGGIFLFNDGSAFFITMSCIALALLLARNRLAIGSSL